MKDLKFSIYSSHSQSRMDPCLWYNDNNNNLIIEVVNRNALKFDSDSQSSHSQSMMDIVSNIYVSK